MPVRYSLTTSDTVFPCSLKNLMEKCENSMKTVKIMKVAEFFDIGSEHSFHTGIDAGPERQAGASMSTMNDL